MRPWWWETESGDSIGIIRRRAARARVEICYKSLGVWKGALSVRTHGASLILGNCAVLPLLPPPPLTLAGRKGRKKKKKKEKKSARNEYIIFYPAIHHSGNTRQLIASLELYNSWTVEYSNNELRSRYAIKIRRRFCLNASVLVAWIQIAHYVEDLNAEYLDRNCGFRPCGGGARGGNVRTIRMLRLLESLAFSEREF